MTTYESLELQIIQDIKDVRDEALQICRIHQECIKLILKQGVQLTDQLLNLDAQVKSELEEQLRNAEELWKRLKLKLTSYGIRKIIKDLQEELAQEEPLLSLFAQMETAISNWMANPGLINVFCYGSGLFLGFFKEILNYELKLRDGWSSEDLANEQPQSSIWFQKFLEAWRELNTQLEGKSCGLRLKWCRVIFILELEIEQSIPNLISNLQFFANPEGVQSSNETESSSPPSLSTIPSNSAGGAIRGIRPSIQIEEIKLLSPLSLASIEQLTKFKAYSEELETAEAQDGDVYLNNISVDQDTQEEQSNDFEISRPSSTLSTSKYQKSPEDYIFTALWCAYLLCAALSIVFVALLLTTEFSFLIWSLLIGAVIGVIVFWVAKSERASILEERGVTTIGDSARVLVSSASLSSAEILSSLTLRREVLDNTQKHRAVTQDYIFTALWCAYLLCAALSIVFVALLLTTEFSFLIWSLLIGAVIGVIVFWVAKSERASILEERKGEDANKLTSSFPKDLPIPSLDFTPNYPDINLSKPSNSDVRSESQQLLCNSLPRPSDLEELGGVVALASSEILAREVSISQKLASIPERLV